MTINKIANGKDLTVALEGRLDTTTAPQLDDELKTALEGIQRFRQFLKSMGMPINFKELGAKEEDIPVLVEKLGIGNGTRAGFMELTADDVTKIYKIAAQAQ